MSEDVITPEMIEANERIKAAQAIAARTMAPSISGVIADRMAKTEQLYRLSQANGPASSIEVAPPDLEPGGYPLRHIRQLGNMHGPAKAKADALLPRIMAGDCIIALIGNRGPGKTQMATFWADQLGRAGKGVGFYRKTADLIGEIKATWGDSKRSEEDVLRKYRSRGYLVLDEFSEKGASDWESRVLVNIIDHRYDNELVTVIIANMSRDQAAKEIHPSILSRAEETGGLVLCDWASYRTQ